MNLEYFQHFFRANYPKIDASNEEIDLIGKEFKTYLQNKFKGNEDKLEGIWNIDAKTVIMNQVNRNPFTTNGYHSALVIHFCNFIKEIKESEK